MNRENLEKLAQARMLVCEVIESVDEADNANVNDANEPYPRFCAGWDLARLNAALEAIDAVACP